ncbi:hypothetical protein RHMOL_Rhmol08G0176900 [Rhododendron molle]|uniref:Uncharacterized protein n=1 Tax=Rhododendron molle TaxID=49168 RepID=A0ACC0MQL8_RHOML|nr:hypothetical protein RHMOL_Rhmol08G0176900 [Rhododendron molle]
MFALFKPVADNTNKRPRREPSYVRTAEINRILKYTGEPGTLRAGRGHDASVLLGYNPSYKGFIDRRLANPSTSATSTSTAPQPRNSRSNAGATIARQPGEIPISEGIPLSRVPLNLSLLLTVSSRGRSTGRACSTGHAPPPPRRNRGGSTRPSSPPRECDSSLEAVDAHRDKCPRNQEARESNALAAGGLLLPVDMQKESSSPSDQLVSTGLVSGIKVIRFFPYLKFYLLRGSLLTLSYVYYYLVYPKDGHTGPEVPRS